MSADICTIEGCDSQCQGRGYCHKHYMRWLRRGTAADPARPSIEERFWAKVDTSGECWEWTGRLNRGGYGSLNVGAGRRVDAHRLSALIHFGMFDRRLFVLHHCDNPRCVRPEHLYLGTPLDNMRDRRARGRARNGHTGKTHCKHGHEFTPENTRVITFVDGGTRERRCRACTALRARRRRSINRAAS